MRNIQVLLKIRFVLEDLGPTFVKFGQIMSLRLDLLPSELLFELSRLQDEVPPVEASKIPTVVEKGLGQSIEIKDMGPGDEYDAQGLAKQGINAAIKQILVDGFFQRRSPSRQPAGYSRYAAVHI